MGQCISKDFDSKDKTDKRLTSRSHAEIYDMNDLKDFVAKTRKHLVVDDNQNNRETLATYLNLLGIDTDECSDGDQVVQGRDLTQYDVIWLDVRMRNMDGPECAQILRERGCQCFLIAVTGDATDETSDLCQKSGMNFLLRKPLFLDVLRLMPVTQ
jgi:CheY-like chemotaxis protein